MEGKEFVRRWVQGAQERERVMRELRVPLMQHVKLACLKSGVYDAHVIDDVFQHCVLKLISDGAFRGESAVESWVYAVARNEARGIVRKARREQALDPGPEEGGEAPAMLPLVDAGRDTPSFNEKEGQGSIGFRGDGQWNLLALKQCVRLVLAALHEEPKARANSQRAIEIVLFLIDSDDPSTAALARYLNCTPGAAAQRKLHVLGKVRQLCRTHCLDDHCGMT